MNDRQGNQTADLLITGGRVIDTRAGQLVEADVSICGDRIADLHAPGDGPDARETLDARGQVLSPGFINTHLHVESSLVTPQEYERMVLPRGTTTIVCDPHEMANVLGQRAFDFFLDHARTMVLDMKIGLSSCVPATDLGTSGAVLRARDLAPYMDMPEVIGLAEMMDIGGMLGDDPVVLEKLELFRDRYVGGHLPLIAESDKLGHFRKLGLLDDHESVSHAEGAAKLKHGFNLLIREGTAAQNLEALVGLIRPENAGRLAFCTDDRHPNEVRAEGELDHIIRQAIALYDPSQHGPNRDAHVLRIYQMATLWGAENFGLRDRGAVEPGMLADLVLLDDLEDCRAATVLKDGRPVDAARLAERPRIDPQEYGAYGTVRFKGRDQLAPDDFAKPASGRTVPVIRIVPGQIVTEYETADLSVGADGNLLADPRQDIAKLVVVERHGKTGNIAVGFVRGFGLKDGAIASTLAHDDHNVIAAGSDDQQLARAVNRVKELGGGFVLVQRGEVVAEQPLPVAGLMSDRPWEEVADRQDALIAATARMGLSVTDPTMTLAFLALPVIPDLKLCDTGLTRFNADSHPVPQRIAG
ncbi:adenine deaminase [Rhodovibrio salinarum]|uniref:adenine deaminase n=1 Tax=Rhodovibrio salinarum TaxID=1087 RepID=UPI0004B438B9|nr:adenine deaminase [Rhodovibrio salinarum]